MRPTHFVFPDFLLLPHMGKPRKSLKKKKMDTAILIVLPRVWRTEGPAVSLPLLTFPQAVPFPRRTVRK